MVFSPSYKVPTVVAFPHMEGAPSTDCFGWPLWHLFQLNVSFLKCGGQNSTQYSTWDHTLELHSINTLTVQSYPGLGQHIEGFSIGQLGSKNCCHLEPQKWQYIIIQAKLMSCSVTLLIKRLAVNMICSTATPPRTTPIRKISPPHHPTHI